MAKHTKMYDKSPKLERNDEGDVAVNKGGDKAAAGADGSSAEDNGEVKNDPHEQERNSMFKRHEEEQVSMHDRHKKDMKEMHKRHTAATEKTGEAEINKTEDKE